MTPEEDSKAATLATLKVTMAGLKARLEKIEDASMEAQFATLSESTSIRLGHIERQLASLEDLRLQIAELVQDRTTREAQARTVRWAAGIVFTLFITLASALVNSSFGAINDRLDKIEARIDAISVAQQR